MIIIGIDPGTATAGYGVIQSMKPGGKLRALEYGVIRTKARQPVSSRLHAIYDEATRLIDRYRPDAMAVEQLFFKKNVTSAISVGQARGIFLLAASQHGLMVAEYSPPEVKQAVTGGGGADKAQIAFMVRALLGLRETPSPDDAADALAVAICHAHLGATAARLLAAMNKEDEA